MKVDACFYLQNASSLDMHVCARGIVKSMSIHLYEMHACMFTYSQGPSALRVGAVRYRVHAA